MNSFLLNRQLGSISHEAFAVAQNNRLLRSIQAAPDVHFDLQTASTAGRHEAKKPHPAGVNSIAIDRFEGRYLLSAGADSSIAIWDLEAAATESDQKTIRHAPLGFNARTSTTHPLSITQVSFYPFDSLAFLTSSYSGSLRLFSSETLQVSASFELGSGPVHSHSTSNISQHLLVACATSHPAVRLVDLRSGSATHSLPGHHGSVLAVAWSPKDEHVLASGATDGSVRLWDVRRSASSLGVLDLEDSVGLASYDGKGTGARVRERGKAHTSAVNGVVWTEDGRFLVTAGHDERMRVWDMRTGANTLAHFGAGLKNAQTSALFPLVAPRALGGDIVFFPNPKEILSFDMFDGKLLSRLKIAAPKPKGGEISTATARSAVSKTTSLAWRAHDIEMYSAHADGMIRCWRPRTSEDKIADEEEREETSGVEDSSERKRKREELEQIVRDLTGKKVTYS